MFLTQGCWRASLTVNLKGSETLPVQSNQGKQTSFVDPQLIREKLNFLQNQKYQTKIVHQSRNLLRKLANKNEIIFNSEPVLICSNTVFLGFSSLKGGYPTSIIYNITPKLHKSHSTPYPPVFVAHKISGANNLDQKLH